jgi:hypothetical protein
VFAVTKDEGHVIVASDIVIVDLRAPAPRAWPLPKTAAIERSPSVSADGARIAWLEGDRVVVGRLLLP